MGRFSTMRHCVRGRGAGDLGRILARAWGRIVPEFEKLAKRARSSTTARRRAAGSPLPARAASRATSSGRETVYLGGEWPALPVAVRIDAVLRHVEGRARRSRSRRTRSFAHGGRERARSRRGPPVRAGGSSPSSRPTRTRSTSPALRRCGAKTRRPIQTRLMPSSEEKSHVLV